MTNKTSEHILNSSVNLMGFCLVVVSSLHVFNKTANSFVDEFTSIVALLLLLSSILSFASIRTDNGTRKTRLEDYAEYLFLISLVGVFLIVLFILISFWNK
ncbi:hypothetical protein FPZ43_09405 [Mucilaginibacter pallidiroseus]|uniref:Uncharacterized protein n=1 Tax=Mucilaginibacter pallidiroseus TaxID=2599295 RepID=A0A563UCX7_9SPHI|nr:hypothetical protein [Mucilaginibacter pallidiroseus]TWR29184.1 hypothetical protein FPZ43_09405 [Mucilaginibacter pallidiroseus]